MYDAYGIKASNSIDSNASQPSWNASERKIGRFAKRLKSKHSQVETPQVHERKKWSNIDMLENDVLQKPFAKYFFTPQVWRLNKAKRDLSILYIIL